MSDVMQLARTRRQELVDAIAEMEGDIAQLDSFLAFGAGLIDGSVADVGPADPAPRPRSKPAADAEAPKEVRDESDLESDMKAARAIREIMPLPGGEDLGPEYDMYGDR